MAHRLTQSTLGPQVLRMLDLVSYQEAKASVNTAPFDAIAN